MDLVQTGYTPANIETIVTGGHETITLAAGKRVQVRSGSAGDITTHLDAEVPAGKAWRVYVVVEVRETDA